MSGPGIVRRTVLGAVGAVAGAAALPALGRPAKVKDREPLSPPIVRRGRLKQGLTRMVLGDERSVEECCAIAARLGAKGIDFFSDPASWPILRRHSLVCSIYRADFGGGVTAARTPQGPPGWNAIGMKQAQGEFLAEFHKAIDVAADNGIPAVILLCGTRHAVSYTEGAENAVAFCNQVKDHAERRGVTLCMELINSTGVGGPPLSLFDHASWGFDVVRRVSSPRVKLLYDIFHAQVMDGNIIDTIQKNIAAIGHFHVGGVPGRHQIDETQELNYRRIASAIADTGYDGFISHEWTAAPGSDPMTVLEASMAIIDV